MHLLAGGAPGPRRPGGSGYTVVRASHGLRQRSWIVERRGRSHRGRAPRQLPPGLQPRGVGQRRLGHLHRVGRHRPLPHCAGRHHRERPWRGMGSLRVGRPGHVDPGLGATIRARLCPPALPALDKGGPRVRLPDARRLLVPRHHPVSSGASPGLAGAAHDRRPPRSLVAGGGRGDDRVGGGRGGRRRGGARDPRRRKALAKCGQVRAGPPEAGSGRTSVLRSRPVRLPRLGTDSTTVSASARYFDRFVARGRCPADDLLDGWRTDGRFFPTSLPLEAV